MALISLLEYAEIHKESRVSVRKFAECRTLSHKLPCGKVAHNQLLPAKA